MMKLLEVVKGDDTSDATFEAMLAWGQGKVYSNPIFEFKFSLLNSKSFNF